MSPAEPLSLDEIAENVDGIDEMQYVRACDQHKVLSPLIIQPN